jgi:6-phosphogluconolactonase
MSVVDRIEVVDTDLLASRAAVWLANALWTRLGDADDVHLAVSGGSTPKVMLAELAEFTLAWHRVHVWQVDERVAVDADPARNARQLEPLVTCGARVHPMPVTDDDLDAAARRYDDALPDHLDVVHLGVGDDGHTASWAPDQPALWQRADDRRVVMTASYRGHRRMTLTPRAVNEARRRLVLVGGREKRSPMSEWLQAVGGPTALPIGSVVGSATTVLGDADALAVVGSRNP